MLLNILEKLLSQEDRLQTALYLQIYIPLITLGPSRINLIVLQTCMPRSIDDTMLYSIKKPAGCLVRVKNRAENIDEHGIRIVTCVICSHMPTS